jgi:hypothetical protein
MGPAVHPNTTDSQSGSDHRCHGRAKSHRCEPEHRELAMTTKIFVNLAVKDLDKSIEFFKKLGFTFNSQFTDETAACMVDQR